MESDSCRNVNPDMRHAGNDRKVLGGVGVHGLLYGERCQFVFDFRNRSNFEKTFFRNDNRYLAGVVRICRWMCVWLCLVFINGLKILKCRGV